MESPLGQQSLSLPESKEKGSVTGTLKRFVFKNEDTGASIMQVTVKGKIDPVTVLGYTSATEGDFISCDGEWIIHPSFGRQLKASNIVANLPMTEEGIIAYLSSGKIKGLGAVISKNIVSVFGLKTFEVMDSDIELLLTVPKIGRGKLDTIKESWQSEHAVRQVTVFLQSHGVSSAMAHRINKRYGGKAIELIQQNPWRLARDVRGIGFLLADKIALNLGKEKVATERLQAGLSYCLYEAMSGGHCGMNTNILIKNASELLEVSISLVTAAYSAELDDEEPEFIQEGAFTWIPHLYDMETKISKFVRFLANEEPVWKDIDTEEAIQWVEKETGNTLADQQKEALRTAAKSRIMVITGGPGCGKTFLLNSILKVMRRAKVGILLAAPTGKAAVRMTESTGLPAATMHRLMKLGRPDEVVETLDCDLLVLDESSMLDVPLFYQALRRLPEHASLLLVGDSDQLPSVGAGSILGNLIDSGAVPVVRLNKVFRQAEGSFIIKNAHRINKGEMPERSGAEGDFFFIRENDPDKIPAIIEDLVATRLPAKYGFDPVKDIQVLSPMKKTATGVYEINRILQARLNPNPISSHKIFDTIYGVGDKVMQVTNNYDKAIFNGDMGVITSVDKENCMAQVQFANSLVSYAFSELEELNLAYSFSIHKCIAQHERVMTESRGLVCIKDLNVGEFIIAGDHEPRKVLDKIHTGRKNVVRITTAMGYSIEVSKEHPILALVEGQHQFVMAGCLSKNDVVCLSRYRNEAENTSPAMDSDLAWLLGVTFADTFIDKGIKKFFPQSLFGFPSLIKAAFLRGIFDTKAVIRNAIHLKTYSTSLAMDIQRILLSLGIASSIQDGKAKHVCISKDDLIRFKEVIGFSFAGKEKQLDALILKRKGKNKNSIGSSVAGQGDYVYDKIKTVDFTNIQAEMYDIEVEGIHSFISNGFVCHNSQGSDFKAVIIPVSTQHFMMLQRNLIYTGITRARNLCILIGQDRALEMAVNNVKAASRNTRLESLLKM